MRETKYVDETLNALNERYPNSLNMKEFFLSLFSSNDASQHDIRKEVIDILLREELADQNPTSPGLFKITKRGQQVIQSGGYENFLNIKSIDTNRQKQIDELTFEKLKYDVKNAKRIFKTYWITFWIALLGFLISLTLLIFKMLE